MRILRCESKGSRELVVQFVDVLVDRLVVQCTMGEVVPEVLHDEEESDLGNAETSVGGLENWSCELDSPAKPW